MTDYLLTELRECLRELESWDETEDAMEIIKANLRTAIGRAEHEAASGNTDARVTLCDAIEQVLKLARPSCSTPTDNAACDLLEDYAVNQLGEE
jgi:hypothetical protein